MTDAEIAELLKNSKAFQTRFSKETQNKMLQELPNLSEEQKLTILKTLIDEDEGLQKIAGQKVQIAKSYEETSKEIVKDADKETKALVEKSEQQGALTQLNDQLNQIKSYINKK